MKFFLLTLFFLTLFSPEQRTALAQQKKPKPPESLFVAWWNVENLFDTVNDATEDDEFTPEGKKEWTAERLARKYDRLAQVIKDFAPDKEKGRLPDIMGCCEVEHEALLKHLFCETLQGDYGTVYYESPDTRGIDVGMVYNRARLVLLRSSKHRVELDGRPTRDILYAAFEADGIKKPLHVICNHWSSKLGGEEKSEPKRVLAAKIARALVDSLLKADADAEVVLLGDFNAEPESASIQLTLRTSGDWDAVKKSGDGLLYNFMKNYSGIGSIQFSGGWEKIDMAIVTKGLLDTKNFYTKPDSFNCFYADYMFKDPTKRTTNKKMFRTYEGVKYTGGYADHLPVTLMLFIAK